MIALDLDDPILDRTACPASAAQLFAEQRQRLAIERHPGDQGHALAAAALGRAGHFTCPLPSTADFFACPQAHAATGWPQSGHSRPVSVEYTILLDFKVLICS